MIRLGAASSGDAKLGFVKGPGSIFCVSKKSPPLNPLTNPSEGAALDSAEGRGAR